MHWHAATWQSILLFLFSAIKMNKKWVDCRAWKNGDNVRSGTWRSTFFSQSYQNRQNYISVSQSTNQRNQLIKRNNVSDLVPWRFGTFINLDLIKFIANSLSLTTSKKNTNNLKRKYWTTKFISNAWGRYMMLNRA